MIHGVNSDDISAWICASCNVCEQYQPTLNSTNKLISFLFNFRNRHIIIKVSFFVFLFRSLASVHLLKCIKCIRFFSLNVGYFTVAFVFS